MQISKPKEYIDILLQDIINITKHATNNMVHENFTVMCPFSDSTERFNKQMEKVDVLKEEILLIIENLTNENKKP